jgi:hypothetical protein
MYTTPINGFQVGEGPDPAKQYPANVDQPFKAALDSRVIARFATAAARNAAIPAPVEGQTCYLADIKQGQTWESGWKPSWGRMPHLRVTWPIGHSFAAGLSPLINGTIAKADATGWGITYTPATAAITMPPGLYLIEMLVSGSKGLQVLIGPGGENYGSYSAGATSSASVMSIIDHHTGTAREARLFTDAAGVTNGISHLSITYHGSI